MGKGRWIRWILCLSKKQKKAVKHLVTGSCGKQIYGCVVCRAPFLRGGVPKKRPPKMFAAGAGAGLSGHSLPEVEPCLNVSPAHRGYRRWQYRGRGTVGLLLSHPKLGCGKGQKNPRKVVRYFESNIVRIAMVNTCFTNSIIEH